MAAQGSGPGVVEWGSPEEGRSEQSEPAEGSGQWGPAGARAGGGTGGVGPGSPRKGGAQSDVR